MEYPIEVLYPDDDGTVKAWNSAENRFAWVNLP